MRRSGPVLLLLGACSINPRFAVPPEVSEGDALVFFVQERGADPIVFTAQATSTDIVLPIVLSRDGTVRTELAIYDDTELDTVWLPTGIVQTDPAGRALPEPDFHYVLTSEGPPDGAPFEPLAWSNALLSGEKFARSEIECLERRRCISEGALRCVRCDEDVDVAPPQPPEPPRTLCPTGWTITRVGATEPPVEICDPRSSADRFDCPAGEVRKLGSAECQRVGRACPASGRFGGTDGIFVDANATPGGDGTLAMPFSTLRDALAIAQPGDVILLSTGAHAIPRTLLSTLGADAQPITVRGACASGTRLSVAPHLQAEQSVLRFEDLELVTEGLFWRGMSGALELDGVHMRAQGPDAAIVGLDARIEVRDSIVDSMGGFIEASTSSVVIANSVVRARAGRALFNLGGMRTTVVDSAFSSGSPEHPVVQADEGGVVSLVRVSFEDAASTGVHADLAERLELVDVFLGTPDAVRLDDAYAVDADVAVVSIERLWILGALGLSHVGARLDVKDVVIVPDTPETNRDPRAPIFLGERTHGSLRRATVMEAHRHAIRSVDTALDVTDLRIENVRRVESATATTDLQRTVGVLVEGDAHVELQRAAFRGIEGAAIGRAASSRTVGRLIGTDLDVRDSGPVECDGWSAGVIVGPNDRITRARFASLRGRALTAEVAGAIEATDVTIADVAVVPPCNAPLGAIVVSQPARLDLTTFTIEGVDSAAIRIEPTFPPDSSPSGLFATHGRIRDVEVGIRYLVAEPNLEALVDVRIDPRPNRPAID